MAFSDCAIRGSRIAQLLNTALVQCMVRRLTAREKLRDEKVCVNVSGLFVEKISWPWWDTPRSCPDKYVGLGGPFAPAGFRSAVL